MKKRIIVLSLGGSLIIPDDVNLSYIKKFRKVILKNTKKYKFIIVCGGGRAARRYISALRKINASDKLQSLAGISATRTNARFMTYFFGKDMEYGVPHTTETLEKYIKKHDIVFCGALEYKSNQTSDSTAAEIANHFNSVFINLTNVPGLYNRNPLEHKDAKFIPEISWKDFNELANKPKFQPGQHFVLDQTASKIILKHKIPTYIIGKNIKQLDKFLKGKKFIGTEIKG